MKKVLGIFTSVLLAGSLLGNTASAATENSAHNMSQKAPGQIRGFINEQESNNTFTDANQTGTDYIAAGTLTDNDKDYYKLEIKEGQRFDFLASTEEYEPTLQLQVDVYNSSFQKITPDSEENITEYKGSFDHLEAGTYYFVVSDLRNVDNQEPYYFATFGEGMVFYERHFGYDRYDTSVEIAKATFRKNEAPHVVLATGTDFPDALAGAPLAYAKDAPILLTKTNEIPDDVLHAFDYFGVKEVTIIGGTSAVSNKVETTLEKDLSISVTRIAGADRYETAANIAAELGNTGSDTAYVTYGGNYPDALSVASIAAMEGSPILLTRSNDIPEETSAALKNYNNAYAIGGPAVIANKVVADLPNGDRISGDNRYETSVNVAKELGVRLQSVNLATGQGFADALAGSVHAAVNEEPVILTRPDRLSPEAKKLFEDSGTNTFTIFGGPYAVDTKVEDEIISLFIPR